MVFAGCSGSRGDFTAARRRGSIPNRPRPYGRKRVIDFHCGFPPQRNGVGDFWGRLPLGRKPLFILTPAFRGGGKSLRISIGRFRRSGRSPEIFTTAFRGSGRPPQVFIVHFRSGGRLSVICTVASETSLGSPEKSPTTKEMSQKWVLVTVGQRFRKNLAREAGKPG